MNDVEREARSKALDALAKKIEFEIAQDHADNQREIDRLMFRYIFIAEGFLTPDPDPLEVTYG